MTITRESVIWCSMAWYHCKIMKKGIKNLIRKIGAEILFWTRRRRWRNFSDCFSLLFLSSQFGNCQQSEWTFVGSKYSIWCFPRVQFFLPRLTFAYNRFLVPESSGFYVSRRRQLRFCYRGTNLYLGFRGIVAHRSLLSPISHLINHRLINERVVSMV